MISNFLSDILCHKSFGCLLILSCVLCLVSHISQSKDSRIGIHLDLATDGQGVLLGDVAAVCAEKRGNAQRLELVDQEFFEREIIARFPRLADAALGKHDARCLA